MTMEVRSLLLGGMQNLVHLIADREARRTAVVDPAWDAAAILEAAGGIPITDILISHWHEDHTNAVDELLETTAARVHALAVEADYWEVKTPLVRHAHDDVVQLGDSAIRLLHAPGHSPGSACFFVDDALFTGDTLFVYGCGRCDLPGGDAAALYGSLRMLQERIPPETLVYPGHHYAEQMVTTFGEQLRANPFLHHASAEDFAAFRAEHNNHRHPPYRPVPRGASAW